MPTPHAPEPFSEEDFRSGDLQIGKALIDLIRKEYEVVGIPEEDRLSVGQLVNLTEDELMAVLDGMEGLPAVKLHITPEMARRPRTLMRLQPLEPRVEGSTLFVPEGYRFAGDAFSEFVNERFIDELSNHAEAFAKLCMRGDDALRRALGGTPYGDWQLDDEALEHWIDQIRRHYSHVPWPEDINVPAWISAELVEQLHRQNVVQAYVVEDRDGWVDPDPLVIAGKLMLEGVRGFWERNRTFLGNEFRRPFIQGRRLVARLEDDGSLRPIEKEWWQGRQCTEVLQSCNFELSNGVLLEKVLSPAEENTAEERILRAIEWLNRQADDVAGLSKEQQKERFSGDTSTRISDEGFAKARKRFLTGRPDLKGAFSRPGPKGGSRRTR